jgi:hypothetical protein
VHQQSDLGGDKSEIDAFEIICAGAAAPRAVIDDALLDVGRIPSLCRLNGIEIIGMSP